MSMHPVALEFHYPDSAALDASGQPSRYLAFVTTLSRSLRLYRVNIVQKVSGNKTTLLNDCLHLTSYPLHTGRDHHWKDAVTRYSGGLVQAIGDAIETHIINPPAAHDPAPPEVLS